MIDFAISRYFKDAGLVLRRTPVFVIDYFLEILVMAATHHSDVLDLAWIHSINHLPLLSLILLLLLSM